MTGLTIINSYSRKVRSNNTRSVSPDLIFPCLPSSTLTQGDFNIDHPADPLRAFNEDEIAPSVHYFDKATELRYLLLNMLRLCTRFFSLPVDRPGVLDLAFACPVLALHFAEWSEPLPSLGSDHIPILIRFDAPLIRAPPSMPNWALTDWPLVMEALHSMEVPSPPPLPDLTLPGDMVRYQPQQDFGHSGPSHHLEPLHAPVKALVVGVPLRSQKTIQPRPQVLQE